MADAIYHVQTSDLVYCRLLNELLEFTEDHFEYNCLGKCRFFAGTAQGFGIECKFNDPDGAPLVVVETDEQARELTTRVLTEPFLAALKGGAGSGFHGHAGRPGKTGGSAAAGFLEVPAAAAKKYGLDEGKFPVIWSGKPGSGGKGTADRRASVKDSLRVIRVGGAYHVVDTGVGPVKTVKVPAGKGLAEGEYEAVWSGKPGTGGKGTADRKAAKLGPGYVVVREGGAYHVVRTDGAPKPVRAEPTPTREVERARATAEERVPPGSSALIPINEKTAASVEARQIRKYGKENVDRAFDQFKTYVRSAPVQMEVPASVLPKILEDGRFKNQHETGTSRGYLGSGYRKSAERNAFGEHLSKATDFPVYGYLDTKYRGLTPSAGGYGDGVTVVFHNSIKSRTTVTAGDSLGMFRDSKGVGSPINDMRPAGMDMRMSIASGGLGNPSYIEAQIHGGVTTKDIWKVKIKRGWSGALPVPDSVLREMDRQGIRYEIVGD